MKLSQYEKQANVLRALKDALEKEIRKHRMMLAAIRTKDKEDEYIEGCIDTYREVLDSIVFVANTTGVKL